MHVWAWLFAFLALVILLALLVHTLAWFRALDDQKWIDHELGDGRT